MTRMVLTAAAAMVSLAAFTTPALAADPQITFTTTRHSAELEAKIFDAAKKVCAESAKLSDADDFGGADDCIHEAMRTVQFVPVAPARIATSEKHPL